MIKKKHKTPWQNKIQETKILTSTKRLSTESRTKISDKKKKTKNWAHSQKNGLWLG